jgi:hypothetical protein
MMNSRIKFDNIRPHFQILSSTNPLINNIKMCSEIILQMVAMITPKPPLIKVTKRVMPKKRKLGDKGYDMEMELTINFCVSQAKSKEDMARVFGIEEFREVCVREGSGKEIEGEAVEI